VLAETGAHTVVELMAHVWSPLLETTIRRAGARRVVFLHDWRAHPGDATALVTGWLAASARRGDRIVALSHHVATDIAAACPEQAAKVLVLFHPDFDYGVTAPAPAGAPLRVVFLGRLAAYKGLDVFVSAAEQARARGA